MSHCFMHQVTNDLIIAFIIYLVRKEQPPLYQDGVHLFKQFWDPGPLNEAISSLRL